MREDSSPDPGVPELPDDLKTFARQLETFGARSKSIDREQLMFEAGRTIARDEFHLAAASSRRTLRLWQSAALVFCAVSVGMGTTMMLRPEAESRAIMAHRDAAPVPVDQSLERTTNEPESNAVVQAATPVPEVVSVESPHASGSLHARQLLVDRLLESDSRSVLAVTESDSSSTVTNLTSSLQPLTPRSLMMGEKSRIWMNRLIEEPKL